MSEAIPSAVLSAWAERRPPRTEAERSMLAERAAAHLPEPTGTVSVSDDDLRAMKLAFMRRFDEDLPRTETLMAVAHVGYRIALRDIEAARADERARIVAWLRENARDGQNNVLVNADYFADAIERGAHLEMKDGR